MLVDGLRLLVPRSHVFEGLAPEVESSFDAHAHLSAPARTSPTGCFPNSTNPEIDVAGGFAPIEAYAWHAA